MRRNIVKGSIRPKVSTMPRQKSEAAAFLDIYKLVVEKKRLQQELQSLDERRKQISNRMAVIDQHVADLEKSVQQMREASPTTPQSAGTRPSISLPLPDNFETLFLEY